MTSLQYRKAFLKKYNKLDARSKASVKEALLEFESHPYSPSLYNHSLKGEWKGYRSISAGFDLRIVFYEIEDDVFMIADVGTHSELYG